MEYSTPCTEDATSLSTFCVWQGWRTWSYILHVGKFIHFFINIVECPVCTTRSTLVNIIDGISLDCRSSGRTRHPPPLEGCHGRLPIVGNCLIETSITSGLHSVFRWTSRRATTRASLQWIYFESSESMLNLANLFWICWIWWIFQRFDTMEMQLQKRFNSDSLRDCTPRLSPCSCAVTIRSNFQRSCGRCTIEDLRLHSRKRSFFAW